MDVLNSLGDAFVWSFYHLIGLGIFLVSYLFSIDK